MLIFSRRPACRQAGFADDAEEKKGRNSEDQRQKQEWYGRVGENGRRGEGEKGRDSGLRIPVFHPSTFPLPSEQGNKFSINTI